MQRGTSRSDHEAAFEHEGHGVGAMLRLSGVCRQRLVEGCRIRPMPTHTIVERGSAGYESRALGVVDAVNQAHELARDIAMEPWRPKRILHREPAGRENHEIDVAGSRGVAGRMQHQEYGWVRMIVGSRS